MPKIFEKIIGWIAYAFWRWSINFEAKKRILKGTFNMHLVNKRNLSHLDWQRQHALRIERYGEYLIFVGPGSNRCMALSLTNSLTITQTLKRHLASAVLGVSWLLIVCWDSLIACHNQHHPHHHLHHRHYHHQHHYNYLFVFLDSFTGEGFTKKFARLLDFVQMRGEGRALPNFYHIFRSAFLVNKRSLFHSKWLIIQNSS